MNTDVSSADRCTQSTHAPVRNKGQDQNKDQTAPLPTPIKFEVLDGYLDGFDPDKREFLRSGFRHGFDIFYTGDDSELESSNSKTTELNPEAVTEKINIEIEKGRIAGPFSEKPFKGKFKCFPLSIREKSTPGKYRLLHNLSYPYDESSVNSNIAKSDSTVQYITIRDIMAACRKAGHKGYIAKADISDAFRLIPLNPNIYHLMGFQWDDQWYYDKCLPMGCSSSCKIFSTFTDAILFILREKFGVENTEKILDDFFFGSESYHECGHGLDSFIGLCNISGIPVAPHKTVRPCHCMIFMGSEWDTQTMEIRLPLDKLRRYSNHIQQILAAGKSTLKDIQSIIGQLQYSTSVVNTGKAFLRRLINLTIGMSVPHHEITLTPGAKLDLEIWMRFLADSNGRSFLYEPHLAHSHSVHMYSDSSFKGYGASYGSYWIQGIWPDSWKRNPKKFHINVLEMYPILALVETFGNKFRNSVVRFHCDNSTVVSVINKQTSRDDVIMVMVRKLVLKLLELKTKFYAVHIPGVTNVLSDAISRFQVTEALLESHNMRREPSVIPAHILPQSLIPQ